MIPLSLFLRLCYRAALCNAGNRISGQAARDQARQAKIDAERHKRFLSRCRRNRNGSKAMESEKSRSVQLGLLTSRSDSSGGSQQLHESAVHFPSITAENSFDSTFAKSPHDNVAAELSFTDAFSSFYEADVEVQSKGSSHQKLFVLGSQATEMSDDESLASSGEVARAVSPNGNVSFKSDIDGSAWRNKSYSSTAGTAGKKSKMSEFPFCSNIVNDYGGGGGVERASEWNMLSSSVAESLPAGSPARHRTGPSSLSFENHLAKIVKGQSNNRFVKGSISANYNVDSVSKVLQGGHSRAISPLAMKSYFSHAEIDGTSLIGVTENDVSPGSQDSTTSRYYALTSKSLLSDKAYIGRSMLNLTKFSC